jgi:hypothetical protein
MVISLRGSIMIFMKNKECGVAPLIILGALAVLLYLIYGQFSTSPPVEQVEPAKEEKGEVNIEQQDLIEDREKVKTAIKEALQKRILMKINVQGNEAWVDAYLWKDMKIEKKQKLLITLAKHFDYEGSLARVNLYDYQSDKKVGTYTLWSGLKFY